jgi:5-methylcytosine-specific restriction endonuclease McrA
MRSRENISFLINEAGNAGHVARVRAAAREFRKSRWWQNLIQQTACHHCKAPLNASSATMDHLVPVSCGGRSTKGNVVPSCKECNSRKRDKSVFELLT